MLKSSSRHGADGGIGGDGGLLVCDVLQALPHPPRVSSEIKVFRLLSVLSLCCCYSFPQSILCSFLLCHIARFKRKEASTKHVAYLTIYPGFLVGKLPDLYGGHDVVNTSANIPSRIFSIVLYADRRLLQSGCSFKYMPVCWSKTVLQADFSLRSPEFDLFGNRICFFQFFWVSEIGVGAALYALCTWL